MRVAVIGAGAMGSIVSYLLSAEHEVVLFENRRDRVEEVSNNGVRLQGALDGQAFVAIESKPQPAEPFDFIILAFSAAFTVEGLRPLSPFVHRDTVYVSFQEGSAIEELAKVVGGDRAAACLSEVSAIEADGGEVEVEELKSFLLLGYRTEAALRFEPFISAMTAACPGNTTTSEDLTEAILKRLQSVAPVSALCAITGGVPEEIRAIDEIDSLCLEAAAEFGEVPVAPWDDAVWKRIKPSMLRDIEAGMKTEIDYLGGWIVSRAAAAGKRVPVSSALVSMVKEIESGRMEPGRQALNELRRRIEEEKRMSLY
ncbi:MAG: hypothetical protein A2W01_00075 [Candidatus Solincola sediminis]|uniref:2-dehydropantoate 2-reductase n=1 Tax=Candidatus Solincola sediminis TaxID=1797199 RepID=A0A1F2WJL5_9ACTN|nr:MAG: hypothetical protein A2Y75_02590 [Candidatus Solincola sediminis]OFW59695.1 MAG: hypothetical protein A2W01_00075 [Candidatus Solincola sediminis]